jgi:hypothetical protein
MLGCLMAFAGDGGGACLMIGVFDEKGAAGGTVMFVFTFGCSRLENVNRSRSAVIGIMISRIKRSSPSRVSLK